MVVYQCPVCKKENRESDKYCMKCGTWLLSETFPAVKKHKASASGWVAGGLMYVFMALTVGICGLSALRTPSQAITLLFIAFFWISLLQLLFGLISPVILPGRFLRRRRVAAVYLTSSLFWFALAHGMASGILPARLQSAIAGDSAETVPAGGITLVPGAGKATAQPAALAMLEAEPPEAEYKASAQLFSYQEFVNRPEEWRGERLVCSGSVIQMAEEDSRVYLLVDASPIGQSGEELISVFYRRAPQDLRVEQGDWLTVWGTGNGVRAYTLDGQTFPAYPDLTPRYLQIERTEP